LQNDRDRAIWDEHFFSNDPISLQELGVRFGVSKQRMFQLADRIKQTFKKNIIRSIGPNNKFHLFLND
jgi:DNA-directed RNA polymerase sigma subunit (sigma70/sigma32)